MNTQASRTTSTTAGSLRPVPGIGLEVMGELVGAEVTEVAGPKGRHDSNRTAYRDGSEAGKVT